VQPRMWTAAVAAVIAGVVMTAVALLRPDPQWLGWVGVIVVLVVSGQLARHARRPDVLTRDERARSEWEEKDRGPASSEPLRATAVPADARAGEPMPPPPPVNPSAVREPEKKSAVKRTRTPASSAPVARVENTGSSSAPAVVEPEQAVVELLVAVPGLGASKQQALAVAFPTMRQLRDATVGDLTAVDRVGPKVATRVKMLLEVDVDDLLSGVAGVGPSKREAIKERVGTAPQLMNATVEQLAAVPGVSTTMAQRIRDTLDQPGRGSTQRAAATDRPTEVSQRAT
jgi:DNA uptake protein ComE-like DNA-binding protein